MRGALTRGDEVEGKRYCWEVRQWICFMESSEPGVLKNALRGVTCVRKTCPSVFDCWLETRS
jgi:hypothetical protein